MVWFEHCLGFAMVLWYCCILIATGCLYYGFDDDFRCYDCMCIAGS